MPKNKPRPTMNKMQFTANKFAPSGGKRGKAPAMPTFKGPRPSAVKKFLEQYKAGMR